MTIDIIIESVIPNINYFLFLMGILFSTGFLGLIFNRNNIIIIIMSIELMLLSINANFFVLCLFIDSFSGQFFSIFAIAISITQFFIGLSIIIGYFAVNRTFTIEKNKSLKK